MARLHLVRHGRAAATWDKAADPGLDEIGRGQAEAVAADLEPLGPLPIIVSPLRRARETATPLEGRWGTAAEVEPVVAEIPCPLPDLAQRGPWLRQILAGRWSDLEPPLRQWREDIVSRLLRFDSDAVIVTHFVVINAAVAWANGDDQVVCCRPDNASHTVIEAIDGRIRLLSLGRQMTTAVG